MPWRPDLPTLHGLLKRWLSCKPKDEVQRPVGAPANEFMMELRYRQSQASRLLQSVKPINLTCRGASRYLWLLYREVVRRKGENK